MSRRDARRVALAAQGFADGGRPGRVDSRHFRRVLDRLATVQLDSVNVVTRSHELVFFARLGRLRPGRSQPLAVGQPRGVRVLGPRGVAPPGRAASRCCAGGWPATTSGAASARGRARLPRDGGRALAEIRDRGPVTISDLDVHQQAPRREASWWGWGDGKRVVEHLFHTGDVTATRRNGFTRSYLLPERWIPADVLATPTPAPDDARRDLLLVAARCHGLGTARDLADYYRINVPAARRAAGRAGGRRRPRPGAGRGLGPARLPAPRGPPAPSPTAGPGAAVAVRLADLGSATAPSGCSTSATASRSTRPSRSGSTATTCCPSCSTRHWSAGSTSRPTGRPACCGCGRRGPARGRGGRRRRTGPGGRRAGGRARRHGRVARPAGGRRRRAPWRPGVRPLGRGDRRARGLTGWQHGPMTTLDALPRWDLTPLYPAVDDAAVAAAEAALADAVTALAGLYDDHGVRGGDDDAPPAGDVDPGAFDEVLAATNGVLDRFARLEAFAYGHVSTDSGDEAAQALLSRLTMRRGPHHRPAHALRRLGGRPRPRPRDRRQPGRRGPRLAAAQGGPARRAPDVRARGVAGRRAGHHRVLGVEPPVRRRQRGRDRHRRARRRPHRDAADLRRARPRHPSRRRRPRGRVPGRARRPGRPTPRPSPPPSTPSRARRWRSAPDAAGTTRSPPSSRPAPSSGRRSTPCRGRSTTRCPTSAATWPPRPVCSARTAAPSGTCSGPSATPPSSRGPTPPPPSSGPSPATATTWPAWPPGRSASAGSTPARGPGRSAAPSACTRATGPAASS